MKIDRDRFIMELNENRVGTSVHFIPLFLHDYYRKRLKLRARDYPAANQAFKEVITVPLFPDIKTAEVDYVCEVIEKICRKYKR